MVDRNKHIFFLFTALTSPRLGVKQSWCFDPHRIWLNAAQPNPSMMAEFKALMMRDPAMHPRTDEIYRLTELDTTSSKLSSH